MHNDAGLNHAKFPQELVASATRNFEIAETFTYGTTIGRRDQKAWTVAVRVSDGQ